MTIFTQWDKLVTYLAKIAKGAARGETQYAFNRIDLSTGKATLKDRAMNQVAFTGGVATLSMPPMEPGRAHDLLVRATCETATEVVFDGGEFEGEGGGELAAPSVGETVIYLFTETSPGVFLASRKTVEKIEEEE